MHAILKNVIVQLKLELDF